MTTTELPAGRELDALVAEKIMGLSRKHWGECPDTLVSPWRNAPIVRCPTCELEVPWNDPETVRQRGKHANDPSPYSTDMAAAWLVVKKLTGNTGSDYDLELTIASSKGGWCTASFLPETKGWGDTAPLAICRAALAAVSLPPSR